MTIIANNWFAHSATADALAVAGKVRKAEPVSVIYVGTNAVYHLLGELRAVGDDRTSERLIEQIQGFLAAPSGDVFALPATALDLPQKERSEKLEHWRDQLQKLRDSQDANGVQLRFVGELEEALVLALESDARVRRVVLGWVHLHRDQAETIRAGGISLLAVSCESTVAPNSDNDHVEPDDFTEWDLIRRGVHRLATENGIGPDDVFGLPGKALRTVIEGLRRDFPALPWNPERSGRLTFADIVLFRLGEPPDADEDDEDGEPLPVPSEDPEEVQVHS